MSRVIRKTLAEKLEEFKKQKVYCGNCRFFRSPAQCAHPKHCTLQDTPVSVKTILGDCEKLNANNDCVFHTPRGGKRG